MRGHQHILKEPQVHVHALPAQRGTWFKPCECISLERQPTRTHVGHAGPSVPTQSGPAVHPAIQPPQQQRLLGLHPAHSVILCTLPTSSSSRKGRNTTTRNRTLRSRGGVVIEAS